jgi:hypothetical protein
MPVAVPSLSGRLQQASTMRDAVGLTGSTNRVAALR